MPTRRQFLKAAALTALLPTPTLQAAKAAPGHQRLAARAGLARLLEQDQPATPIWGYEGRVPGPELRTPQAKPFVAELINELSQPTTIHWHGIRIANAMDGVAGLTQPAVAPGERFTYAFTPPDAGTYWYHPHNRTSEQLARGLAGAFIVEEAEPPGVDQDLVLMFDDWRIDRDGKIHERSFGSLHDIAHAGRLGNILTLNGAFEHDVAVKSGQRLRLRLINCANARVLRVDFEAHVPIVIALDGQPVATPFAPDGNAILLAPAQRADVIVDCGAEPGARTEIVVDTGRERLRVGRLVYDTTKRARRKVLGDLPVLPPNPMPMDLRLKTALELDLVMTGGAMAPFEAAEYRGKNYGMRELARAHGKVWAFNGIVGMPMQPLVKLARGTTASIRMVNRTVWPHAMHFHGHHVREVAHSAREPVPHWRDTVLVRREEDVSVAFVAHNPGKWMLHCHMLGHQDGGMSTWFEVS